jgi:hypothetical protein
MPSTSKKQQRFFGLVKSIQDGRTQGTGQAQQAANSMSQKDVKDFASTKHDNLPEVKEERAANTPTDPLLWDKAKSKATSQFDGVFSAGANNWAAKWYRDRGGDWKTEAVKAEEQTMNKQALPGLTDADKSQLLNYSLISALVGLGGAGAYGLVKGIHDNTALSSNRLRKYENRLKLPKSKKQDKYLPESPVLSLPDHSAPSEMLSDDNMSQSDLPADTKYNLSDISGYDKNSGVSKERGISSVTPEGTPTQTTNQPGFFNSMLTGALMPAAMIAPAAATYLLGKNLIDRYRKHQFNKELEKAKDEFEGILSKSSSSSLQKDVDSLFFSKTADGATVEWKNPGRPSSDNLVSTPGFGLMLGLPVGVGGLLGWALMNQKMKSDPQQRKLKELNNLLKRDISLDSLSAGIDLDESSQGKPTFKL